MLGGGCAPAWYARWADKDAQKALAGARASALGGPGRFDLTYRPFAPTAQTPDEIVIGDKTLSVGRGKPQVLTLDQCLEIAFRNSRTFQNRREALYTSALAVASGRQSWNFPELGGDLDAEMSETRVRKGDTTEAGQADGGPTFTQRLITGGVIVLGATIDMATDFLGSDGLTVGSLLDLNITQPLLAGAWTGEVYEGQYRRERDLLFTVFDYERFTQTFAVGIVDDYYAVLELRDQMANEAAHIERLKDTLSLTKILADGGQVSRIQQDQAEQNLLNAEVRYERTKQTYLNALDDFKLTLGLPVRARLEPDYPGALEALGKAGPGPIPVEEDQAIEVALTVRPDVLTERADVRDAERDVRFAADAFLPELDLEVDLSATGEDPRDAHKIRFDRRTQVNRLSFRYELNQVDNRDDYREAMIALERAKRDLAEFEDEVRNDVRRDYRTLRQSRRSYELQVRNVEIAKRRNKLASLQQREGQASARDVLEAEEDLRDAQNGLTNALVSYTTTRLNFLAAMGMLSVDEKGKINELADPVRFERIRKRYKYVGGKP